MLASAHHSHALGRGSGDVLADGYIAAQRVENHNTVAYFFSRFFPKPKEQSFG